MSVATPMAQQANSWRIPLRYALRELRGGLRGFYVFIACIALGSMAIAGVGSLAASLGEGLAREGRVILGGDLAFTLIQREAAPNELAFLKNHGALSIAATTRAMARSAESNMARSAESNMARSADSNMARDADSKATLVELK